MANAAEQHIFFLDDEPDVCEVVGETLQGLDVKIRYFTEPGDCLRQLRSQRCDLLISDVGMPEMNGVELLLEAKRRVPWVPVLLVTGNGDIPTAVRAIKAGAVDFIEKPLDRKFFLRKVKSILQRSASVDSYVGKPLTWNEKRVLSLVIEGMSNKEIADLLHRSIRTIEMHRAHVMRKLGVDNLVDLFKRVAVIGLVDLPAQQELDNAT